MGKSGYYNCRFLSYRRSKVGSFIKRKKATFNTFKVMAANMNKYEILLVLSVLKI